MEPSEKYLHKYKGCYFFPDMATLKYLDSLEDYEIRDNDVFVVTYPKSGTVWMQNILSLIYYDGHRNGTEDTHLAARVPWLEYNYGNFKSVSRPSPRLFVSHLPHYLMPKGLRNGRAKGSNGLDEGKQIEAESRQHRGTHGSSPEPSIGIQSPVLDGVTLSSKDYVHSLGVLLYPSVQMMNQIIYVARNPKDVLISLYHYSKISVPMEKVDFGIFMERFLAGKVPYNSWLDHIEGWFAHQDDINILFLTYEDMKKNLRSSVLKICSFLGKRLTKEELDDVVDKASFDKMKVDQRTNYENMFPAILDKSKGCFLRKGTIGDWKNMMTVTQNERFDSVFKERMEKLPFKFCWDINEEL